jgi:hypothetical protein
MARPILQLQATEKEVVELGRLVRGGNIELAIRDAGGDQQSLAVNPSFSTRCQNALFFGKNRPPRRLNKGTGSPKCL